MKLEGFNKIILGTAFDYLVLQEIITKAFMIKNKNLKNKLGGKICKASI